MSATCLIGRAVLAAVMVQVVHFFFIIFGASFEGWEKRDKSIVRRSATQT